MSTVKDPAKLRARIERDVGGRLREFVVDLTLDEAGEIALVVRGAAGSVTALRGLREKVQPIVKKAIRDELGGGYKFDTVPEARGADLYVAVKLSRV